jgi:hypothetical protein
MGYEAASTNVWPITHPDNTPFQIDGSNMAAGDQVGKYWGERGVGNVAGATSSPSGEYRLVFEFDGTDATALAAKSLSIPEGYGMISTCYLEVSGNAFASGTVDLDIGGSPINTAPVTLTALGMVDVALGAIEPIDSTDVITVSNPTAAVAHADGSYAKVIVELTRV